MEPPLDLVYQEVTPGGVVSARSIVSAGVGLAAAWCPQGPRRRTSSSSGSDQPCDDRDRVPGNRCLAVGVTLRKPCPPRATRCALTGLDDPVYQRLIEIFEPQDGSMSADIDIDRVRANAVKLEKLEGERLLDRSRTSERLYRHAATYLPLGVASSFQTGDPYPIYLARGSGSHLWDADGNEYL